MDEDLSREFEGRKYRWQYDDESGTGEWVDECGIEAAIAIRQALEELVQADLPQQVKMLAAAAGITLEGSRSGAQSRTRPATPFTHLALRNWAFREVVPPPGFPQDPSTLGSGPFEETEFDEFLEEHGIQPCEIESQTEVLVIGHEGWEEAKVDALIEARVGKRLRIYSQEMFLSYLLCGCDPFDSRSIAGRFRDGHPALEWLSEGWPGWVTTTIPSNWRQRAGGETDWEKESPLAAMGYHVGKSGASQARRRRVLTDAFQGALPRTGSDAYMAEWGEPDSAPRLKKMAESIAWQCALARNRRTPPSRAIADWEGDLAWLNKTFYRGHMRFRWPSTNV